MMNDTRYQCSLCLDYSSYLCPVLQYYSGTAVDYHDSSEGTTSMDTGGATSM